MAGKAKEKWGRWVEGTYILGDGLVNGYPHWLKLDESKAIWFDKNTSAWLIGKKSNLGKNDGGIGGPFGKDSYPDVIKQGWTYADKGEFVNAGPNDVIFKLIS